MISRIKYRYAAALLCIFMLASVLLLPVSAVTVTGVSGVEVTVDSNGSISESGGTVTAKVTGSFTTRKTTTITVKNTSGKQATISFYYSVSNHDSSVSTIDDLSGGNSGTYSVELAANATKTFTMCSNRFTSATTATATLSSFSVTTAADKSTVTLTYGSLGTVTTGGATAANNSTHEMDAVSGKTFVATANSGATFLGWIDAADGKVLSTSGTFTLKPLGNMTLRAVFTNSSSSPCFWGTNNGQDYLFESLPSATAHAASATDKVITLAADGTLPAGNYTIPAGVKLLIPNSASDTGAFGGEPSIQIEDNITNKPAKVFRTLTVPSGATITCYGEINVNGHRSANGQPFNGHVIGNYGKIILGTESKTFSDPKEDDLTAQLIIGEGGKLYCYGYITGSGMVHVQKNATLHELLQMADWPGGTNGISWGGDNYNNLFLATQYYIQNIEAPLKLEHGATQYVEAVITISVVGEIKFSAPFISSSDGLFITSGDGYFLRIYDQAQDRMNYHIKGGSCTIGVLSMEKTIMFVPYSITTENSIMPVTNNISIYIEDGTTFNVNKPVAILPGAEVIIQNGATANIENAAIYIYDVSDWSGIKSNAMSSYFNRVQQAISQGWAPTNVNTDPKTNPLPYVATLNGVSPRATGYYYYTNDKGQPMTNPKPITASGKLEVNGTANIKTGGYAYVSIDGSSADKAITGTGKIIHNGNLATAAKSIASGTDTYAASANFNNALGNLAGVGTMQPFTNGGATYFGLGEDYGDNWYQHVVMVANGAAGVIPYNSVGSSVYANKVPSNAAAENSNVVGYAANTGSFSFTVNHDVCKVKVGETELTATDDGVYTISNITSDVTITLVEHNELPLVAVGPTCTETGLTAGTGCSTCGETLVAQEELPALGHKWFNGGCKNSEACEFKFRLANMAVREGLDMYFYIQASDVEGLLNVEGQEDQLTCRFTIAHADEERGTQATEVAAYEKKTIEDVLYYRYCFSGIAAKEMMDKITAQIVYKDSDEDITNNEAASKIFGYSVHQHILDLYNGNQGNAALCKTLADLLNYGANCQILFKYNQNNLANDNAETVSALMAQATTTDPSADKETFKDGRTKGTYFHASTFSAKNKLMFTFYYSFPDTDSDNDGNPDVDPKNFKARVSYTDINGSTVTQEVKFSEWYHRTDDDLYGVDVKGITLPNGRAVITCELLDDNNNVISTSIDSITGYAARTKEGTTLRDTMVALLKAIDSAKAYQS